MHLKIFRKCQLTLESIGKVNLDFDCTIIKTNSKMVILYIVFSFYKKIAILAGMAANSLSFTSAAKVHYRKVTYLNPFLSWLLLFPLKRSICQYLLDEVLFHCWPKIVSEYNQEIPQSQTADNPMAPRGRATQPSRDIRDTN